MKTIFFQFLLLALGLIGCSRAKTPNGTAPLTFLHAQGVDMVNENNQKVFLKGVGLGNWMLPEGYMWRFGANGDRPRRIENVVAGLIGKAAADSFWTAYRRDYITEKDIEKISQLGFNSVRPALNARLFLTEDENPQFVQEGFDLVDSLVTWCTRHKIYVILDMHGAPGGQTGQNIDDSEFDEPRLFMDDKYEPRLTKLWLKLAEKFKDNPTVAAYDLLNEPLPKMTGAADKYKHLLEPMYKRLTSAIRAVDKKHIIILEGVDWSNDWSVFSKPFDNNLVYQFHYYCWNPFENVNSIQNYIDKRAEWNVPVWVGETGEKTAAIHWATIQLLNENNMGWSFWPWKKLDTRKAGNNPFSIKKPAGWDSIAAYSSDKMPTLKEWAKPILNEYLTNIRLQNCVENVEMINSMLQRIPAKVEAENFGGKGAGISYFVNDTTKTKNYRTTESVKIDYFLSEDGKSSIGQYITLSAGEWTAYSFGAQSLVCDKSSIRIKSTNIESAVELMLNGIVVQTLTAIAADWQVTALSKIVCSKADNKLEIRVVKGSVQVDYIDVR